jgi:hypothetical protein
VPEEPRAPTGRPAPPEVREAPFFVVGAARSGTTLLRVMLDGHSRLALPEESDFVVTLLARRLRLRHRPGPALEAILRNPRFKLWALDPVFTRAAVVAHGPADFPDVVRAVFSIYARSQGKARWGDKTPDYVLHMGRLARLFPDARFLHVIRDGREVAVACADYGWVPTPVSGAYGWRRRVARGERAGRRLGPDRYLKVHLEQLIAAPEAVLARICEFLDERYEPAMLDYPATVESRYPRKASSPQHRHLVRPPTEGLRDWRAGLSPRRQRQVEAACGRWLGHLGYSRVWSPTARSQAQAFVIRLRDTARFSVPHRARLWLHPTERRVT